METTVNFFLDLSFIGHLHSQAREAYQLQVVWNELRLLHQLPIQTLSYRQTDENSL